MKKIIIILCILVTMLLCPVCIQAEVTAWGYCMIDGHTGRVLYEKNADIPHEIASITKILTAICALEHSEPSEIVTVSQNASGTEGSSCWLEVGEQLTMEEMLYGLLLASGNDAAVAIAEHISGNMSDFVLLMNETAQRLGAHQSQFKNPHGLDEEGHYSSCFDMAIITKYAMTFPLFRTIVATQRKNIPWQDKQWDRTLNNHNKFLSMYPNVIGVKTGYTDKAGRTLVTAVEKDDIFLILVTIAAPDDWNDHKKLYDLAFSEYSMQPVPVNQKGTVPVVFGKEKICSYSVEESFKALLKEGEAKNQFSFQANLPDKIHAPIQKGEVIGRMDVFCKGELIDSLSVIADQSVEESTLFERFFSTIQSIWYKIFAFCTA